MKKINTVIYYYSTTGNSLYEAREIQKAIPKAEIQSISEDLQEDKLVVNAECVGFVFPMRYFGLPIQVEEFLQKLTIFKSPYIFAIATCGVPYWGRPFMDAEKILREKNRSLHASWYVRLVSNYIPLRDIAADWRINIRAWLAKGKLQRIAKAINNREAHSTWQLFKNFCGKYHDKWLTGQTEIDIIIWLIVWRFFPAQNWRFSPDAMWLISPDANNRYGVVIT